MVNTKLMHFSDSSGWGSPPKKKIRILLADDHTAIREAMAGLFELKEDFEVVGQAGDGVEAVQLAEQTKPDVVLMDVSMPRMDGFEATARIKRKNSEICIIGLSMHEEDSTRERMISAGASAYYCKAESLDKLFESIRSFCG